MLKTTSLCFVALWIACLVCCSDANTAKRVVDPNSPSNNPPSNNNQRPDSLVLRQELGFNNLPSAEPGDTLERRMTLRVSGFPGHGSVTGEVLSFRLLEGDAALLTERDTTDSNGIVRVQFRAGTKLGPIRIVAESLRTGESTVLLAYVNRPDRFGALFFGCGHFGVSAKKTKIEGSEGGYSPRVSPDRSLIAFVAEKDGDREIYVLDRGNGEVRQLTHNGRVNGQLTWSPDGAAIAYQANANNINNIAIVMLADGGVSSFTPRSAWPAWSPVGDQIAFSKLSLSGYRDIWLQAVDSFEPVNLSETLRDPQRFDEHMGKSEFSRPQWSPDASTLAFIARRRALWIFDIGTSELRELLADREGGISSFAWDPASETVVYSSLRSGATHLFLYRPAEDLWCRLKKNAGGSDWLVPGESLIYSGRDPESGQGFLYELEIQ